MELTRVYDLCQIDARNGAVDELTAAEQDQVVDECYQCKLCYSRCPYTPPHEWQIDSPKLMLRGQAVGAARRGGLKGKVTAQALGRTDLMGTIGTLTAPVTNRALSRPGSPFRKVVDKALGVASERVLQPYARTRFSTWFKRRRRQGGGPAGRPEQTRVAIFATCLVEYQDPTIGHDLVKVYERNGVGCDLPDGTGCCGAPWLHSGDFGRFTRQARVNVEALAASVRAGNDIVVPQPTCGYVLKREYPEYLATEDARLVAEHTYDAGEYLWMLHEGELRAGTSSVGLPRTGIDTVFPGEVPATTAYHLPCHLRAQGIGLRSRDLIALTGTEVTAIEGCSGVDGMWGMRSDNYELSRRVARPLVRAIDAADAEVVAGDCHLANGAIEQETGRRPIHPLQLLARAYGIEPEPENPRH